MQEKKLKMSAYGLHQYWLNGVLWTPDNGKFDKVIHIVYGVTEHLGRYYSFAEKMTQHGIAVAGFDLRGHGSNDGNSYYASFISGRKGSMDYGWNRSLYDLSQQKAIIMRNCEGCQYYLMGVSTGTLMVREYLNNHNIDDIAGVILIGAGQPTGLLPMLIKSYALFETWLTENVCALNRSHHIVYNYFCKKMGFECKYNTAWINSDSDELDVYMTDENVKKVISSDLLFEVLCSSRRLSKQKTFDNVLKKQIPLLLLSGKDDFWGDNGAQIHRISKQLKSYNAFKVKSLVIPNARHDILHEYRSGVAMYSVDLLIQWLSSNYVLLQEGGAK